MKFKDINVLSQGNLGLPFLLKEIPSAPLEIYILGEMPDESLSKIAIVGTRKATTEGRSIANQLARSLSRAGAVIVSGLAMGIDTAAHEGALSVSGRTIAVLGNGIGEIYPRQNENLAKRILEANGAIISEYPAGTPSFPNQFLERNRIVSGLCIATIVIEAPEHSGALVTARLAAEQGREVFVVPGPVNHPNYRGSHQLIRDGARLVASVEDILEDLNINIETQNSKSKIQNYNSKFKTADTNQLLILKTIQEAGEPLNIDKIIQLTKLEPQTVNQSLALLIIEDLIKETEKGYSL